MPGNKVKVLVLGKSGMLGHMVFGVLKSDRRLSVCGTQMTARSKPDYFNVLDGKKGLRRVFNKNRAFDYCVNCIGITANKIDEKDPASVRRARMINSGFPGILAETAAEYGCKVVHISTDGVFSGKKRIYDERSRPDCEDVYGRTKLAGEVSADNFLVIRCSILGPSPYEHAGLWEWFSGLPAGSHVKGFSNHIWNGVTTLQFGLLCKAIIFKGCFDTLRSRSGVYHFAPNKPLSKYDLLKLLKSCLKKNVTIERSVQGSGKISRVLRSRFRGLRRLVPSGTTMRKAVNQLLNHERK